MDSFVPLAAVEACPPAGRVRVQQGELLPLARGLLRRGLVRPLRQSELIVVAGRPLLNGLFG
eukprot:7359237-Lingulodinium_polyedra.AAC.1